MYSREQLVADVTTEANNIRQHATTEELAQLDFNNLDPLHMRRCIYGQMTGSCNNLRALQLIEVCTPRYFKGGLMSLYAKNISMSCIIKNANGTKVENFINQRGDHISHFSAIEVYILLNDAKNENLINYIKGNTQTLEL